MNRRWSRTETLQAMELYFRTPFGRIHMHNPEVLVLADKLDRSPGSVTLKMTNFASLDPTLKQAGMANCSKLDRELWQEFFGNPDGFFEQLATVVAPAAAPPEGNIPLPMGEDRMGFVKQRIRQSFFRRMVLAAYEEKCAITGLSVPELLVASHIIPWSVRPDIRTDPRNGLCLNALHDRAFDRHLLTITEEFHVVCSKRLLAGRHPFFTQCHEKPLTLPRRFLPDQELLKQHRKQFIPA